MACWYRVSSPPPSGASGAAGAIGIITLSGNVAAALARLGLKDLAIGRTSLRDLKGIDTLIIAHIASDSAMLFPHAGPAVMSAIIAALETAGIQRTSSLTPREKYPEARTDAEAHMLDALARAESHLAIDLLLDQPRRWTLAERSPSLVLPDDASRTLNRLIEPPLVVAIGPPNIGKSSLVNALAGRGVAIVADTPGTTRDHVGVTLNLAGLIVRYLDTPGIGHTAATGEHAALDREAQTIALRLAQDADLILLCADAGSDYIQTDSRADTLRIGLRSDLGPPRSGADLLVSVRTRTGLEALTGTIRDRLVPPKLLADPRAWRFWPEQPPQPPQH
jgi:hypothetical protein